MRIHFDSSHFISSTISRTPQESSCDNKWHPEYNNADGCSNSLSYPKEWLDVTGLFFDTKEDCCKWFKDGEPCKIYDECQTDGSPVELPTSTASACTSSEYHPDMVNKDGCSNSIGDYPA
jgi:hypothetical protein